MSTESTQKVRTGVMYIRESTAEQGKGYSPDAQRQGMKEYAKQNNIKINTEYLDLLSGRTDKRPEFQQMINDAEARKFDVVLIYKTSRFARNRTIATKYKNLLRKIGVQVISTSENLGENTANSGSVIMEGFFELFDEHASNQISEWTRAGFKAKRQLGFLLGRPPLGYRKEKGNPEDVFVDEQTAPLVKEMFELYAAGDNSLQDIAVKMNEAGHVTQLNNPFTYSSIKCTLQNRTYLGLIPVSKPEQTELQGKHEAIISEALFDRVQEVFKDRDRTKGRPAAKHRFYLLQGLVHCYQCRRHLKGKENSPKNAKMLPTMYCQTQATKKYGERYYYGCKFRRENKSCSQKSVLCSKIDKQVLDFMAGMRMPKDVVKEISERVGKIYDSYQGMDPIERKPDVSQANRKLEKLNHMYLNTESISRDQYNEEIVKLNKEIETLEGASKKLRRISKKEAIQATETFLNNIPLMISSETLSQDELRAWIRMTIKRVWVKNKKVVAIEPHDDYKNSFTEIRKVLTQRPLAAP